MGIVAKGRGDPLELEASIRAELKRQTDELKVLKEHKADEYDIKVIEDNIKYLKGQLKEKK